ncbi:MAG TPA: cyclase family protein [Pyrinomonadaceae bacterium]|nr:cyclase family protein [Pyrinomonadaceae bacterium]
MTFQLIDLSHTVEAGMITYKGLPAPVITDHLSREESRKHYSPGTQFHIGKIVMVANTGTYLDSPFHRYEDGKDLSELDLASLANLEALVISGEPDESAIGKQRFEGVDVQGKAVLIHTGWDRHWRTDEYWSGRHPFLTKEAAELLAQGRAGLVGIDSYNIDSTSDASRPAHSILLRHDVPIVEHLCHLDQLPAAGFRFFAVPVKVRNFGTFPVRAFALVHDG